jgi:enoyl-CoA hydratase
VALIEHHITGGVARVTLNNPERRNALTAEMADELVAVLDVIETDPSVGAVVLNGAGKGFCSGADLRTLDAAGSSPLSDEHYQAITAIYAAFTRFGSMSVPTIAAVTGAAVGAGLNLALAADLRIVAEDARLMSGFARIGVHPGGGHLHLLARMVGRDTVAAMALFSEEVSGLDAVRLGLAWRALPTDEVLAEAERLADTIADKPELARALTQSLRLETPGQVSWDAAVQIERAPQLRTFHKKAE